jgi:hypothetical protein
LKAWQGRDKRELKNRLRVLLNPLLKRIHTNSPENYQGWEATIREQRRQLQDLLEQSPSLRNYFIEVFPKCWQDALKDAQEDYFQVEFPSEWKFSYDIDALLGERFWES